MTLFFPTSALVYNFEYANQQFRNQDQILNSPTLLSENNRVSNMIGYNGAITERFSLTALIGYGAGFYKVGEDYDGVLARVDTRWRPRPTIGLTAGYLRDIRPSFIGNFVTINRLHATAQFTGNFDSRQNCFDRRAVYLTTVPRSIQVNQM